MNERVQLVSELERSGSARYEVFDFPMLSLPRAWWLMKAKAAGLLSMSRVVSEFHTSRTAVDRMMACVRHKPGTYN